MYPIQHSTKKVLFDKNEDEPLTPEEQAEFNEVMAWIQPVNVIVDLEEPEVREAVKIYNYIKKEHTTTWEQAKRVIMQDTEPEATIKTVKKRIWLLTKWAAAASIVLIVGYYIWSQNKSNEPILVTVKTSPGNVRVITLPDGSTVWLNKGSTITYPEKFTEDERTIKLSGEAYFIVKHDASKPFRVVTGNTEIVDLGTEFDVSNYANSNSVITIVKEGKVRITDAGQEKEINPGQQAIVKANGIQVLKAINIDSTLKWKIQSIKLEGRTTESVMEQIHSYYDVPYSIQAGLPPLDLTSELSVKNSLDSTIKSLDDAAENISFKYRGGKVMVTRE
jgi:ferric-dicitrate binding protein FerR (iron transport regulator)